MTPGLGVSTVAARYAWWLIPAFLILLPAEPLFNVPMVIMAIVGLIRVVRSPAEVLADQAARLLLLLFLCIWLPMVVSLVDAVNFAEAVRKTAVFPLYFLAGLFVLAVVREVQDLERLLAVILVVTTAWCVDAIWQFISGASFLGFPFNGSRLSGVFHPRFTLSVVLAILSPIYFEAIRRASRKSIWVALLLVPYAAVIALGGSRSSWMVLLVSVAGYSFYLYRWGELPRLRWKTVLGVGMAILLAASSLAYLFPSAASKAGLVVMARVDQSKGLLSMDRDRMDEALAWRLSIWETAARMGASHWINGVGPRGFRYAYADYASKDDFWTSSDDAGIPTHPHLLLVEVAVETGLIGVAGYLIFFALVVKNLARSTEEQLRVSFPFWLAVITAMLPLNVHKSFYGNFSASLTWWLIMMAAAGSGVRAASTRA